MSQEGEYEDWVTFIRWCFTAFHQGFCFLIKLTVLPFQTAKLSAYSVSKRASTSWWSQGMEKMASFLQKCRGEHKERWSEHVDLIMMLLSTTPGSLDAESPQQELCVLLPVPVLGNAVDPTMLHRFIPPAHLPQPLLLEKTPHSSPQKLPATEPAPFVLYNHARLGGFCLLKWRHRGDAAWIH